MRSRDLVDPLPEPTHRDGEVLVPQAVARPLTRRAEQTVLTGLTFEPDC